MSMLSRQEVSSLVRKAQQGDKSSLDVLFDKFKPFRHNLASSYANKGLDMDDVIQEIDYMFVQSVLNYDDNLDGNPVRHIVYSTRQKVYTIYRKEMVYRKRNVPRGLSVHIGSDYMDTTSVEVDDIINNELGVREGLIIRLAMQGYLQVEIAEMMDLSPPTVNRILASARGKLKNLLDV